MNKTNKEFANICIYLKQGICNTLRMQARVGTCNKGNEATFEPETNKGNFL